jgi:hypothetical protein
MTRNTKAELNIIKSLRPSFVRSLKSQDTILHGKERVFSRTEDLAKWADLVEKLARVRKLF